MGKLRLGQVRLFAKLMQLRSMKQNWHSTLSLFDTCILFSTPKLLGPFGKWKEQRLKDEETSVFKLLRQACSSSHPHESPRGWGWLFIFPFFQRGSKSPREGMPGPGSFWPERGGRIWVPFAQSSWPFQCLSLL